jgi:hypothetical protein
MTTAFPHDHAESYCIPFDRPRKKGISILRKELLARYSLELIFIAVGAFTAWFIWYMVEYLWHVNPAQHTYFINPYEGKWITIAYVGLKKKRKIRHYLHIFKIMPKK